MSNYIRPRIGGARVFFTVNLANRHSDLLVRHIDLLRDAVRKTRDERPFGIEAWVVLPNHMHCIWQMPLDEPDYSLRWRIIKARFSRPLPVQHQIASAKRRGEKGIWQRRFWEHHIRSDAEFDRYLHHCWNSPVRCGFVSKPQAWRYSSVHFDPRFGERVATAA